MKTISAVALGRRSFMRRLLVLLALGAAAPGVAANDRADPVIDPALRALQVARAELAQAGEVLSAHWLIGHPVHARNGELSAHVSDAVVGADGRLAAIVVQARGMRGTRGGLFKIPWQQLELTSDYAQMLVPLTRHNAWQYRLRRAELAANEHRLSMMLLARVALRQGEPYGTIADLVFTRGGGIKALLVEPFGNDAESRYAYPYRHDKYREGVYTLRYDYAQIARVALPDPATLEIVPAPPAVGGLPRSSGSGQQRYDSAFPIR
jgi:hypothetical protein